MNMDVAEKIAELERRIAALEGKTVTTIKTTVFDTPEWKEAWNHFDKAFEKFGQAMKGMLSISIHDK